MPLDCPEPLSADAVLSPRVRAAVRLFYKGKCQYCGGDDASHIEHIVSRASGGADTLANATLACEACNLRKSSIDLDPMFVAIAHARARDAAPQILALVEGNRRPSYKRALAISGFATASLSTSLPHRGDVPSGMTAESFRECLRFTGRTLRAFAAEVGARNNTVDLWAMGSITIPRAIAEYIEAQAEHRINNPPPGPEIWRRRGKKSAAELARRGGKPMQPVQSRGHQ